MKKNAIAACVPKQDGRATGCAGLSLACALMTAAFAPAAKAGVTDLSDRPLATLPSGQVKPNLMLILDDSGSMKATFMPQDLRNGSDDEFRPKLSDPEYYGFRSAQCNGLAYDPSLPYLPPLYPNGSSYPNADFNAARDDGYVMSSSSTSTNLEGRYYYEYKGAQPKMGWAYTSSGVDGTTAFYAECTTQDLNAGSSVFNKVTMHSSSPDAQKYANWYSYYRRRYLLMRTAMGRGISALDANYRVGFSKLSDTFAIGQGGSSLFRDVKDFVGTHKEDVYASLYQATGLRNTPLRGALSKAGQYFANKANGQTYDPVQYSCQRNYALLTTDGYWNTGNEGPSQFVSSYYGPYKLDNKTLVGDQDGTEVPPMKDAAGASNTLADVAQYYYATDLRTGALGNCTSTTSGNDTCSNTVRPVGRDDATWQHMTTFTIGLGVNGSIPYDKDYLDPQKTVGPYVSLTDGTLNWPAPVASPSEGSNGANIDDLWHAAVNGRGQYYSALTAGALADAFSGIMTSLIEATGSASAASTSSLELVPGNNNQAYGASYTTEKWTGDLQAFALNGADAAIAKTPNWSAQAKLDAMPATARKIYFSDANGLQPFDFNNLSAAQQAYFSNICAKPVVAAQCNSSLNFSDKTLANNGANLVDYLRGVRSYESAVATASPGISATTAALYRKRDHLLGDIINSAPVHVGKPPFSYGDAGYADFVATQASRKNVVYVAANDGMLHAFSADGAGGGSELWAYVPGAVMPNLYKLADASYASKHQSYVNATPVMADIKVGGIWKTILVGGLGDGGRSYYALDITDPASPKALWEFTDANMGLSYGNPVVTKRADGTWVVVVSSGYNNTGGDGQGHLYVLDANSGAKQLDIATGVGSSADPSGLAKITAWIDDTADNTSKRFYGGDLKGNLWRFDIDNLVAPHQAAMLLATFQTGAGTPQPITTKPQTVEIAGKPVVVVGTGSYLGQSDLTDTTQQSIYAVKDALAATGWGDVRADTAHFVKQTFTLNVAAATATIAAGTGLPVDWASKGGWWIDLPHTGERVNTNPGLQYGTLAIASAIPSGDACSLGGSSWRYFLDVNDPAAATTAPAGEQWSANALIVGLSWVKDSSGNVRLVAQGSNGEIRTENLKGHQPGSGVAHRTSWRELTD